MPALLTRRSPDVFFVSRCLLARARPDSSRLQGVERQHWAGLLAESPFRASSSCPRQMGKSEDGQGSSLRRCGASPPPRSPAHGDHLTATPATGAASPRPSAAPHPQLDGTPPPWRAQKIYEVTAMTRLVSEPRAAACVSPSWRVSRRTFPVRDARRKGMPRWIPLVIERTWDPPMTRSAAVYVCGARGQGANR